MNRIWPVTAPFATSLPAIQGGKEMKECPMSWFVQISFDEVVAAFITCLVLREVMIFALPDTIAGPGGWLIDTGADD